MNFKQIATTAYLTASISFVTLFCIASRQAKSYVNLLDNSNSSIKVEISDYLDLIDGRIDRLESKQYIIRRRFGSTPVARKDSINLYALHLDVYNHQGTLIGTRTHNLPK